MMRSGEAVKRRIKNVPKTEGRDGEVLREEVMENLKALCACVLEPLRRRVGRVIVTSGYRSPVLNKAIHGAFDSQHLRGEAWISRHRGRDVSKNTLLYFVKQTSIR